MNDSEKITKTLAYDEKLLQNDFVFNSGCLPCLIVTSEKLYEGLLKKGFISNGDMIKYIGELTIFLRDSTDEKTLRVKIEKQINIVKTNVFNGTPKMFTQSKHILGLKANDNLDTFWISGYAKVTVFKK